MGASKRAPFSLGPEHLTGSHPQTGLIPTRAEPCSCRMKTKCRITTLVLASAAALALRLTAPYAIAQTNAFTYQGQLTAAGSPADGRYDLTFQLFDAPAGGSQVSVTITNANQAVSNGLFAATLDFGGGAFTGSDRWLQIAVRTNGGAEAFVPLAPRQLLTPAPYALYALSATMAQAAGNVSAANITGQFTLGQLPQQVVTNGASDVSLSGTFAGNGAGLANLSCAGPTEYALGSLAMFGDSLTALLTDSLLPGGYGRGNELNWVWLLFGNELPPRFRLIEPLLVFVNMVAPGTPRSRLTGKLPAGATPPRP